MIDLLKKIKRAIAAWRLRMKTKREIAQAFRYDRKVFLENAGALHLDRMAAARAEIIMGYHVLEKGLTMPHRRVGFGIAAVRHLVNLIEAFEKRFGRDSQVDHAAGVLRAWRNLHAGFAGAPPCLDEFLAARPDIPSANEPHCRKIDFFAAQNAPFPEFARSRHVVRHFSGELPKELLEKALELAFTAPSACNRQPVKLHVIENKDLIAKLFALQGGTRGFGQDADKAIVATVDLSAVRWSWERRDPYVNGGIFVMNLCYALHYYGIAHCILHWSVPPKTDMAAHGLLSIPANEAIVQVIACGLPPDEFDVAASPRISPATATIWHRQ